MSNSQMKLPFALFVLFNFCLNFPLTAFALEERRSTVIVDKKSLTDAERIQLNIYMSNASTKLKRHWFPPRDGGAVTVRFQINMDGSLSSVRAFPESNCKICDQAALKAVIDSAQFRPLPPGCSSIDVIYHFDYMIFDRSKAQFKILTLEEASKPGTYLLPSECTPNKSVNSAKQ